MKVWCVSFFIPGHGYGTLEEGWLVLNEEDWGVFTGFGEG